MMVDGSVKKRPLNEAIREHSKSIMNDQCRFQLQASFTAVVFLLLSVSGCLCRAAEGEPLAIKRHSDGSIGLESHWGLKLIVNQAVTEEQANLDSLTKYVHFGLPLDHQFQRLPNQRRPDWIPFDDQIAVDNVIRVRSHSAGIRVFLDGVAVLVLSESWRDSTRADRSGALKVDVVVMPSSESASLGHAGVAWLKSVNPRIIAFGQQASEQALSELAAALGTNSISSVAHQTIAVSMSGPDDKSVQLVRCTDQPWKMPAELSELFDRMDTANRNSQQVFRSLSADQLNFKPGNGTHTPRWNAEHMMGRQLLFFSQIYHAIDPTIAIMDLNPKQMPPDYKAAHPAWNGPEEAFQMERVLQFSRRFAYLLEDVNLDVKAPGSRWTLRGLLLQMERHYNQHTENTIKKFALPNWPSR